MAIVETPDLAPVNEKLASHGDEHIAQLRTGPGILVLASDMRLLHATRKGWDLVRELDMDQPINSGYGFLPPAIVDICSEVQRIAKTQPPSRQWEQLEIRKVSMAAHRPVLLRGFSLPGSGKRDPARVLILLEEVGRKIRIPDQAKERFQLTVREQTVIECIARGATNKEIAAALGITEPTVKAHIRHIMEKTSTTTRTGILAQVLYL